MHTKLQKSLSHINYKTKTSTSGLDWLHRMLKLQNRFGSARKSRFWSNLFSRKNRNFRFRIKYPNKTIVAL